MTEYAIGQLVRTLTEIVDGDGRQRIPDGVRATVIGFAGKRIVLEWDDEDGETVDAVADPWQVYRLVPRVIR